MCVLFYSSFVCTSAYANVYSETTIIKQNIKIILLVGILRVRRLRSTLLLHTTCVRSCYTWRASCVAAKKNKKTLKPLSTMKFQNQTLHLLPFKLNLRTFMFVLFCCRLFVHLRMRMSTSKQYANV